MTKSVKQFIHDQKNALKRKDIESCLSSIHRLFLEYAGSSEHHGNHILSNEFDALCQQAGQLSAYELMGSVKDLPGQPHNVIVVTEIECLGGHAEIVRDIIRTSSLPVLILASNINNRKMPVLESIVSESNVLGILDGYEPTLLAILRTMQVVLANPAVARIYLLMHGYDSVATASVSPKMNREVFFLHHCDHYPALGSYLDGVVHIDLHNVGFLRCRNEYGLFNNRYICLSSMNLKRPRMERVFANPCFKTATCGGYHKINASPYYIEYKYMVVELLRNRNGVHFHIGKLMDQDLVSIYNMMAHYNISEEQFIYIGETPNLPELLTQLEIDLYLPTLPQSGGKAMIDVMAAGVPVLAHQNARNRIFGSTDLIYPEALTWSDLKQFNSILDGFDEPLWLEQSKAASRYFEQFHSGSVFIEQMEQGGVDIGSTQLPPLKAWQPDIDHFLLYQRS